MSIDTTDKEKIEVKLVALGKVVDQMEDKNQFGSQALLPAITKLLKKNNIEFKDLEGIEVKPGPGSFTGIKVGAAVANALGYGLGIAVNAKKLETDLQY